MGRWSHEVPRALPNLLHASSSELMLGQTTVLGHGMKVEVNDYLRSLESSSMRSLKDVINFNDAHAELEFPYPNMDQKGCAPEVSSPSPRLTPSFQVARHREHRRQAKRYLPRFSRDMAPASRARHVSRYV
jgi:hypothetical protein